MHSRIIASLSSPRLFHGYVVIGSTQSCPIKLLLQYQAVVIKQRTRRMLCKRDPLGKHSARASSNASGDKMDNTWHALAFASFNVCNVSARGDHS